jgi:probable F420-dependent oxidoreductase
VTTDDELKVRIGIGLGVQEMVGDRAEMIAVCRAVEEEGFDSLWFSEVATGHALDPVATLGFVAASTERIKMGTGVLVLPGRPPSLVARSIATLDLLSGGRVLPILGLGTVDPVEQQAFGVSRGERGPWVDEATPLLRKLWSEENVVHRGSRFSLDGITIRPRPRRPPPLWFGGRDERELRRAGRLGDGWLASFATPAEVAAGIEVVRASAVEHGRSIDVDHYGVLLLYALDEPSQPTRTFLRWRRPDLTPAQALPVGGAAVRERLTEYVAAGASKFVLVPADRPSDWRREMARLADEVLHLQTPARTDPVRRRVLR